MEFRHQTKNISGVPLADVKIEETPIVINYADQYEYNQPRDYDELILTEDAGLYYDAFYDHYYLGGTDPYLITDDNKMMTLKYNRDNAPLYYQYQLKYDTTRPENIHVLDEDQEEIVYNIEYAHLYGKVDIEGADNLLSYNSSINYDELDAYTRLGDVDYFYPPAFNNIESLIDGSDYNNLPFITNTQCLQDGPVTYGKIVPENGYLDFYLAIDAMVNDENAPIVLGNKWGIWVKKHATLEIYYIYSGSYTVVGQDIVIVSDANETEIEEKEWFRFGINFSNNMFSIFNETHDPVEQTYGASITNTEFVIDGNPVSIFNLAIFNDEPTTRNWDQPSIQNRYHPGIFWNSVKPVGLDRYRVRILLPDNKKYDVKYDAINNNNDVYRNKIEWSSSRPIYEQNGKIQLRDWYHDNVDTIYATKQLHYDIKFLDIADTTITLKSNDVSNVSTLVRNNKIEVVAGVFRDDGYGDINDDLSENLDFYHIPEYKTYMPTASDNQGPISPDYIRGYRDYAEIIDNHTLKINPFFLDEGSYPDYIIPNAYEPPANRYAIPYLSNDTDYPGTQVVVYYDCTDANMVDYSLYKNPAALTGTYAFIADQRINTAIHLNADAYIDGTYTNTIPSFTNKLTFITDVNIDAGVVAGDRYLINFKVDAVTRLACYINDDKLNVSIVNGLTTDIYEYDLITSGIVAGEYSDLALIVNQSNVELYVNRKLIIPESSPEDKIEFVVTAKEVVTYTFGENLVGSLDEIILYNTAETMLYRELDYLNARGITIRINNQIIDNSNIDNYDFNTGELKLLISMKSGDVADVSYLYRTNNYVLAYPKLDLKFREKDINENDINSFAIYIRAQYPNYAILTPTETMEERVVYRTIVDGVETGNYRSCMTDRELEIDGDGLCVPEIKIDDDPLNNKHVTRKIADITLIPVIHIDDIKQIGGGLKSDEYFGSSDERLTRHRYSWSFLDIMYKRGLELPQNIVFIKMHSDLLNTLLLEYNNDKTVAYNFLKKHIEKHIALGQFYVIVDENDNIIENSSEYAFPNRTDTLQ